ncbi:MAG: Ig-like domain-containing protein, partial [Bacteroidota bacterium]
GAKPELLFDCNSFGVRALTADSAGNLYAGTWPGGTIYKISPEGKGEVFAKLPCDYIWALAFDANGSLLAGTGPDGELYQVDSAGSAVELIQLPQAHILSLLPTKDAVYLGTASKGLTYKLLPDRRLLALLDADTDDVTSLVLDGSGTVCAGTSGGTVYRLPEGRPSELLLSEKSQPVYALALASGKLYAATGTEGKVLAITGDDEYATVQDTDRTHVLCLATAPDKTLYAGTGNMAEIVRFDPTAATDGTFTSSVFDAKRASRWTALHWQGDAPAGTELTLETRSGNSANPDDGSWSGWATPTGQPGNQEVNSPDSRYLQYRVRMKAAAGVSPELRRVAISYLPANQRPKIEFDDLDEGQALRAKAEVAWSASDDDGDQMTVKLEYRPAGTTEWKSITEIAAKEESYDWDTSGIPDGAYDLRLTASDEISNPGSGLSSEKIAYGISLDNAAPEIAIQKTQVVDGKLVIEGLATDNNRVAEVAYQTDDLWRGAVAVDGAYDGQYEQFRLTVPLKDNKAEVEVRVRDAAGNTKTETVTWPLESPKDAPKAENKPRR